MGGLAAAFLLPFFKPVLDEGARPLLKALLKQSMRAWERVRGAVGIAAETLEDLLAEIRAELDAEAEAAAAEATVVLDERVDGDVRAARGAEAASGAGQARTSGSERTAAN